MKVGKEVPVYNKKWVLEVVVKYPEPITEAQAQALVKGFLYIGMGRLKSDEPLPTFEVLP